MRMDYALMVASNQGGGNMAAAVAMIARDRLTPTTRGICLKGQILITPMLDPSQSSKSMKALGKCVCQEGCAAYLPSRSDVLHPYAAPAQSRRFAAKSGQLVDPTHARFSSVVSTIKQFIQDPA